MIEVKKENGNWYVTISNDEGAVMWRSLPFSTEQKAQEFHDESMSKGAFRNPQTQKNSMTAIPKNTGYA